MTAASATGLSPVAAPRQVGKWTVAVSIAIGSVMATIDTSIVNVAMPQIRGELGASLQEITWVTTAYLIAMVLVMPLTGFLGSFFGQKRVYIASLVLFTIGSVLCGTARSLELLVLWRVVQGIGGGALQPTQQAILRQTFPPAEQGMAMAVFSMVIMVGPAVGPVLGGWITDDYSWPWIFFVNLPVGILGIWLTARNVHEPADVLAANRARAAIARKHLDWAGIALMAIAIGALQYVLEEGPSEDWFDSTHIVVAAYIAAVGLVAFVIRELTATAPVVDLRMFRGSDSAISATTSTCSTRSPTPTALPSSERAAMACCGSGTQRPGECCGRCVRTAARSQASTSTAATSCPAVRLARSLGGARQNECQPRRSIEPCAACRCASTRKPAASSSRLPPVSCLSRVRLLACLCSPVGLSRHASGARDK
jgi:MFS family permease